MLPQADHGFLHEIEDRDSEEKALDRIEAQKEDRLIH